MEECVFVEGCGISLQKAEINLEWIGRRRRAMKENKIKLLVCYHKKAPLFKDEILTPIHVGRANAKKRLAHDSENYKWLMENLIGDDTGENISDKNDFYNEMTAVYWAWKNYEKLGNPEYIGLMHYRRHFLWDEELKDVLDIRNFDPATYYEIINYSPETVKTVIQGCDFISHTGRVNNVYRHYIENQRKEDIDLANEIVLEKYPEYKEVMEQYYAGDYSNFCNMCIFRKDLFFRYCKWIFSILEEFEKRVDMSEKRFFISERLTGLFVAMLQTDKKLTCKELPIAFIDEPVKVPVVIRIDMDEVLTAAVTLFSILENADDYNSYHFYLLFEKRADKRLKEQFAALVRGRVKCEVELLDTDMPEEMIPLCVPKLLSEASKCIYLSGKALAMRDLGEFYRICSVDDYFAAGIPVREYAPDDKEKKVGKEILVLNCKRMRKHETAEQAEKIYAKEKDSPTAFNEICRGEIGYIPWYFYTSERLSGYAGQLFHSDKRRTDIQAEALWCPFMIYDQTDPVINHQGVYSIFWWNIMRKLPLFFQKIDISLDGLSSLYAIQQKEINTVKEQGAGDNELHEEWRNYGLWGKLKFYYKHNGMKNTISYMTKKVTGRGMQ